MVQSVADNFYTVHDTEFKFLSFSLGTRMTIIKLSSGDLWIHSPTQLNDGLKKELNDLGTVKYIITPNLFHHLFAKDFITAWPDAQVYGPRGMTEKHPDFKFAGFLDEMDSFPWSDEIDAKYFIGSAKLAETVFFHKPSKTMITADLLFNLHQIKNWWTGLYARLMGIYKKVGLSGIVKLLVKDKPKARQGIDDLLTWDIERISLAHGEIVEDNAKQQFQDAWAWAK